MATFELASRHDLEDFVRGVVFLGVGGGGRGEESSSAQVPAFLSIGRASVGPSPNITGILRKSGPVPPFSCLPSATTTRGAGRLHRDQ